MAQGRGLQPGLSGPLLAVWLCAAAAPSQAWAQAPPEAVLRIDYPAQDSTFPPDIAAPTFLFRDSSAATAWRIAISFSGGAAPLQLTASGEHMRIGEIDPRCVSPTNRPPQLTPQEAASRTWSPDRATWEAIKSNSTGGAATITIRGYVGNAVVSRGHVTIHTSTDPVGAPIFYRDVPLMPSETERGVIKPLAPSAIPLIAWRLRDVAESSSRVLMQDLHTCANCHSFSRDGKTLGMDLDGPQNDKGLYTLVPVRPIMTIRNEDVVSWTSFRGEFGSQFREGFMSQVSPDGRYVVTTIKPPGTPGTVFYYVANFTDYRFLQVFYPTRGILVWYDRETRKLKPLPGADDPRYVQASAVWSPDGKYLVFVRAPAKDPYPAGTAPAAYANDPKETPIQYDLYRIPFNGGQGGRAEPIAGASANGVSNSFPKVSPDGRWIVFVEARNGQLMRPDSRLYIVPATGATARRMQCNTPLMNSWHSFSPNGRWMVFSSKGRSPYTQMYLTHIDEQGNDTPAILIGNSTAANRAVNIPEFVNIAPGGISRIDTPATDFYRQFDAAADLARNRQYNDAIPEWVKALAMNPDDARAHNNFGLTLAGAGRAAEALAEYRRALELRPDYPEAHNNLAIALIAGGKFDEALPHLRAALEGNPASAEAHNNIGRVLAEQGRRDDAQREFETALALRPGYSEAHNNLAVLLAANGRIDDAIRHYRQALDADPGYADAHNNLGTALAQKGRMDEAIPHFERAIALRPDTASAYGNLGRALLANGRFADAVPRLEKALALSGESAGLHNLCGDALVELGRIDDAIRHFEQAAAIDPANLEAQANLGRAYAAQQHFDQAVPHLEKAVALAPQAADLHSTLGEVLLKLDRPQDALAEWRRALLAEPNNLVALNGAAWVLATTPGSTLRNGAESVRLATRAVELTRGEQPVVLATLAAAYAEAGRFAEAIETQRRAIALAAQRGGSQMAEVYKARLVEFQARRPLRVEH